MSDGLTPNANFAARVVTAAAGSQWKSADCNSIQDKCILISTDVDETRSAMLVGKMGSYHDSDSPAPDSYGGRNVWVYALDNGTTAVVLDDNLDWRDRIVEYSLATFNYDTGTYAGVLPGLTDDEKLAADNAALSPSTVMGIMYTEQGQATGSSTAPRAAFTILAGSGGASDTLYLYVRSTDGALMMKRSGTTDPQQLVMGRFSCSPKLNQY